MPSPPKLLTVTLNPAVDRNYAVPGFAQGGVHVAHEPRVTAGGKGINVARVWKTLGGYATATGFLGGSSGEFIRARIAVEGIGDEFEPLGDATRTCLAINDAATGDELIINERGPTATHEEQRRFLDRLRDCAKGFDFVAISGSAPVNVPPSFYAEVVEAAKGGGARVLVDVAAGNLCAGTEARPAYLKPNREEAAALGASIGTWEDAASEALKLLARTGVESVMVSGGPSGAVLAADGAVWSAVPPSVDVCSTIGSGDSMAAGFLWGVAMSPGDWAAALRWAVAAGTANATTQGAGYVSLQHMQAIWGRIHCIKLA